MAVGSGVLLTAGVSWAAGRSSHPGSATKIATIDKAENIRVMVLHRARAAAERGGFSVLQGVRGDNGPVHGAVVLIDAR